MNSQECWRDRIKDSNPFRAKNHSVNSWRINKEIQGERRFSIPTKESRSQRKRDKKILDRVRVAVIEGDYSKRTPQEIGQDIDYLRRRGYTSDMIVPTISTPVDVAVAAD